jgi:hypothetical protein
MNIGFGKHLSDYTDFIGSGEVCLFKKKMFGTKNLDFG